MKTNRAREEVAPSGQQKSMEAVPMSIFYALARLVARFIQRVTQTTFWY